MNSFKTVSAVACSSSDNVLGSSDSAFVVADLALALLLGLSPLWSIPSICPTVRFCAGDDGFCAGDDGLSAIAVLGRIESL